MITASFLLNISRLMSSPNSFWIFLVAEALKASAAWIDRDRRVWTIDPRATVMNQIWYLKMKEPRSGQFSVQSQPSQPPSVSRPAGATPEANDDADDDHTALSQPIKNRRHKRYYPVGISLRLALEDPYPVVGHVASELVEGVFVLCTKRNLTYELAGILHPFLCILRKHALIRFLLILKDK